jgi:hypothetical protein
VIYANTFIAFAVTQSWMSWLSGFSRPGLPERLAEGSFVRETALGLK